MGILLCCLEGFDTVPDKPLTSYNRGQEFFHLFYSHRFHSHASIGQQGWKYFFWQRSLIVFVEKVKLTTARFNLVPHVIILMQLRHMHLMH